MRKIAFISVLITCNLFCSKKGQFVNPKYETQGIAKATLVIAPLHTQPQITYPDDVREYLKVDVPEELYVSFLHDGLPLSLKAESEFQRVISASYKNQPLLQPRILNLNNDEIISVSLPVDTLEFESGQPDFTLFLENLNLSIQKDKIEDGDLARKYKISGNVERDATYTYAKGYKFLLIQNASFAFYDNKTKKLAAYGKTQTETIMSDQTLELVFKDCMDDLAKALVKDTPFSE